jgi:protein phosphatase
VKIVAAAATDIGQVREGNEDSFLVDDPLFAVADGMGGHVGGEVASNLALDTIERLFDHSAPDLRNLVQAANRAVLERSLLDRTVTGMGTTLTAVLVEADRVRLAHVGDSRAYLLRDGRLQLLTEDHTLVHRMVTSGEITEEEAGTHPHRSILTRALGVEMTVNVDTGELPVRPGDRLLLCTDGLTGMITEGQTREILAAAPDPEDAAKRLVRAANRAGGVDNITVIVIDLAAGEPAGVAMESEATGEAAVGEAPADAADEDRAAVGSEPPAPRRRRSPFPWKRLGAWVGAAVIVVIVLLVALRVYVDSQWYVGVADGRVAVYRGIPVSVTGFDLHHVVLETQISAVAAERLALYRNLTDGITADDREEADAIVQQIRHDVAIYQQGVPAP